MRIDSIIPAQASPGQSVIIQGEGLESTTKVFFDENETPFEVDGETLVVPIPDISGTVAVTVEGATGTSDPTNIIIG